MKAPIKAGSFSIIKDFETCPFRVFLAKVEKEPEPEIDDDPNHPLIRGDRIHKEAEAFIRGEGPLTRDLRRVEGRLNELKEKYQDGVIEVEQKWGFNRDWEPVDFFADDVWLRVICDVVEHLDTNQIWVEDWKSGRSFGNEVKHTQQKQLYGIAAMMRYPQVQHVGASMQYVDEGKEKKSRYNRDALPQLLERWTKRIEALTSAITFPPKPSRGACRFCPFGPSNGTGACAYGVEV